jgi:DNA ligase-1
MPKTAEQSVDEWDGEHALPTLYSKTATGAINTWEVWLDKGSGVVVRWGQKGGALQTSVFQCERKNVGRANATTAVEQARLEAIAKWKKQLKKKYYVNIEEATGPKLRPMLAAKFDDKQAKVKYPVAVQPKFDGVRCLAYREGKHVVLHSRGGDPYDVEHIRGALEKILDEGDMLDGEIYVHGMSLQNIISLVKRSQEESKLFVYHVYDFVHLDLQGAEDWTERGTNLRAWFDYEQEQGLPDFIKPVQTYAAANVHMVKTLHDQFVREGYEGAIVRTYSGTYRIGYRSSDLLKVKSFDDGEFIITGWCLGKGKFANVPIFTCKTSKGKTFEVTPRGTDEVRALLKQNANSMIGKPYTVRHFGLTDEGVPRFPVGIGLREKGT